MPAIATGDRSDTNCTDRSDAKPLHVHELRLRQLSAWIKWIGSDFSELNPSVWHDPSE
jgi:hypothetical protein